MKDKGVRMNQLYMEIAALEEQKKQQLGELRQTALHVVHGLSPVSLLKDSFRQITASPGLRHSVMVTAVGIGAGLLGKKLLVGRSNNVFRKIGGLAFEFMVSNFVRTRLPLAGKKEKSAPLLNEPD